MKKLFPKILSLLIALTVSTGLMSQSYSGGSGTSGAPYQIANKTDLIYLSTHSNDWNLYFEQTADISFNTDEALEDWDGDDSADGSGTAGFSPIGNSINKFTGSYDGQDYTISNLFIDRADILGLFGWIGESSGTDKGNITNLILAGVDISASGDSIGGLSGFQDISSAVENVHVSGAINGSTTSDEVGGLIGEASGTITNCSFDGDVTGEYYLGGLIGNSKGVVSISHSSGNVIADKNYSGGLIGGMNGGTVTNSYSTSNLSKIATWVYHAGGFIGRIESGTVRQCYSTGNVASFRNYAGGFVGTNKGEIYNCFSTGNVSGNKGSSLTRFGGFVGWNQFGKVINCYSTGAVEYDDISNPTDKGFAGYISTSGSYEMTGNFWDTKTSGQTTTSGVATGKTTAEMTTYNTFSSAGWDFVSETSNGNNNYWDMDQQGTINNWYPILIWQDGADNITSPYSGGDGTSDDPYQIDTLNDLQYLSMHSGDWDKYFKQTAGIDADSTHNWNEGKGFSPIGNSTLPFTGSYDGGGDTISNLYINQALDFIGLFGVTDGASIDSLGITSEYSYPITIIRPIGRLAITEEKAAFIVSATEYDVSNAAGGLVGYNENSTINNCYTSGVVQGPTNVGGLVGCNKNSEINNCYSKINVTATIRSVGGLVGYNIHTDVENSRITNCYSAGRVNITRGDGGGLVGFGISNNAASEVSNSFWDIETAGTSASAGGTGKETFQMKDAVTFTSAGWDFMDETTNGDDNHWGINPEKNGGYPFLAWQGYTNVNPVAKITTSIDTLLSEFSTEIGAHSAPQSFTVSGIDLVADLKIEALNGYEYSTDNTSFTDSLTLSPSSGALGETIIHVRLTGDNTGTYNGNIVVSSDTTKQKVYTKGHVHQFGGGDGTKGDPWLISNLEELKHISQHTDDWDKYFLQTVDIDASATQYWDDSDDNSDGDKYNDLEDSTLDGNNEGFSPIGNSITKFTGFYNGGGHIIKNITINRPSADSVGFFGSTDGATIKNLGINDRVITGNDWIGGLVGVNGNLSTISRCYSTGGVSGNDNVGGLVGENNNSAITNSYSTDSVTGTGPSGSFGGLVGINKNGATIDTTYSNGIVTGDGNIGALVGKNNATVSNSFWNTDSIATGIGDGTTTGPIGKTTVELQTQSTFTDWNFTSIWVIDSLKNNGYPYLKWQYLFPGGSGTKADPYQIANLEDLWYLTEHSFYWDKHFIQIADIDADSTRYWDDADDNSDGFKYNDPNDSTSAGNNEGFSPIGNDNIKFTGSYNGQNFSISNLYMDRTDYVGFFGWLGEGSGSDKGNITNLNLVDVDLAASGDDLGGLTAFQDSSSVIDSVHVSGTITGSSISSYIGGAIGNASGFVKNCSFNGDVIGQNYVGGLIGDSKGDVTNSHSSGNIEVYKNYSGGLIGLMSNGTVTQSYSNSNLSKLATTVKYAGGFIGGIINLNDTVSQCYSTGNVSGFADYVGGFVGKNNGKINNCYSRGSVSRNGNFDRFGGFIGWNDSGKVINCYSTGTVEYDDDTSEITNKGFAGQITLGTGFQMTGNFWDTEISKQATTSLATTNSGDVVTGATGKTTAEMQDVATFTNATTSDGLTISDTTTVWDFVVNPNDDVADLNLWDMDQAGTINDGYPILSWQDGADNIVDNVAPVIQCNAQEIYLSEDGTYILSTAEIRAFASGTTDNVDDFDDLEITVSRRGFNCSQVGEDLDAKVIVTDQEGNSSSCWTNIRVFPPSNYQIDTVNDIVANSAAGECSVPITYPDFINDNCAPFTQIEGLGPDSLFPIGTTTEIWVSDIIENNDTISFNVTVTATNAVPTLDSLADVDANEDAAISIELSGISTGNDCEEQQATVTAENSNTALIASLNVDYTSGDTTATLAVTLVPDASGTAEITVTVEDEMGATVSKTFTITVSAVNDAPYLIAPIPDQTINASYILKIPISPVAGEVFGDVDNDSITLALTEEGMDALPGWATFTNDTLLCQPMIADTGCVNIVVTASDGELTAADTFQICVAGYPTAINDLGAGKFEVNLYPNPTKGMVNVDIQSAAISDIELTVLDITGKQIVRKNYSAAERITFDMSDRVSGMYFVKLDFEGKQVLKKLIVRSLP